MTTKNYNYICANPDCGRPFSTSTKQRRCCSKRCTNRKVYLDNPEKRRAAQRKYNAKPEAKKRRAAYDKAYKAKKRKRKQHNEYMRKYYQEVIKPRNLAAAKLPPKRSKLYPISLIRMTPEQMLKNWDRIV
jgi:hypothetical protein